MLKDWIHAYLQSSCFPTDFMGAFQDLPIDSHTQGFAQDGVISSDSMLLWNQWLGSRRGMRGKLGTCFTKQVGRHLDCTCVQLKGIGPLIMADICQLILYQFILKQLTS